MDQRSGEALARARAGIFENSGENGGRQETLILSQRPALFFPARTIIFCACVFSSSFCRCRCPRRRLRARPPPPARALARPISPPCAFPFPQASAFACSPARPRRRDAAKAPPRRSWAAARAGRRVRVFPAGRVFLVAPLRRVFPAARACPWGRAVRPDRAFRSVLDDPGGPALPGKPGCPRGPCNLRSTNAFLATTAPSPFQYDNVLSGLFIRNISQPR